MTRKIKQFFIKYLKSRLLWKVVIVCAKTYNYTIRLARIFSCCGLQFGPPSVRNKGSRKRVDLYNEKPEYASNPAIYKKIYDQEIPKDNLPITVDNPIHRNAETYLKRPQYEHFVAGIPNGKIVGTYTNVTPDYKILWDGTRYPSNDLYSNPYIYRIYLGKFTKDERTVALLTSNDSYKNYRHWILNVIPKYHLYQQCGIHIDAFASDYVSHFNKETLEVLGISGDRLIKVDENTRIECKKLLISSTVSLSGYIPRWSIDFLQSLFVPKTPSSQPRKRVFISRITSRKVSNEQELLDYLLPLGFERVVLDTLSIKQQAELFNNAEYVIGAHGAGLVNIVFCKPGTKVIELQHQEIPGFHIFALSTACNHPYAYVRGETVKDASKIEMDQDMFIPVDKLAKTMQLLG